MKRNQPVQIPEQKALVRLVDIGPRMEFFPVAKPAKWNHIQRHLSSVAAIVLTTGLVLHLTVGSGAALVDSSQIDPAIAAADQSVQKTDLLSPLTLEAGNRDLTGPESLSRGLSAEELFSEKLASTLEIMEPEQEATEQETEETDEPEPSETTRQPEPSEPATVHTTEETTESTTAQTTAATTVPTTVATTVATTKATTTAPAASSSALSEDQQQAIIDLSRSLLGVDYVLGGTSPSGIDCSGLTLYVYDKLFDISLDHSAQKQVNAGISVKRANTQVGDILCFDYDRDSYCDHVGIYIGGGHYINASRSRGKVVDMVIDFDSSYLISVRRLVY